MQRVGIDLAKCLRCGFCTQDCPCFSKGPDENPIFQGELSCVRCGHCVAGCPAGAIQHNDIPLERIKTSQGSLMPEFHNVMELLRTRRSRRAFTDRPVERGLLENVLEAVAYAPSAENNQSTELVVIQNKQVIGQLVSDTMDYLDSTLKLLKNPVAGKLAELLYGDMLKGDNRRRLIHDFQLLIDRYREGDDGVLHQAPAVILFHANKNLTLAAANANLAVQNASLAVETLGLGSFYAGYLVVAAESSRKILGRLGIPKDHRLYGALAIGHPRYEYKKWIERKIQKVKWL